MAQAVVLYRSVNQGSLRTTDLQQRPKIKELTHRLNTTNLKIRFRHLKFGTIKDEQKHFVKKKMIRNLLQFRTQLSEYEIFTPCSHN
jgi:hypothetical protein